MLISAAFSAPTGRTGGGPTGIPGNGGSDRCMIAAGGPTNIFSGWLFHPWSASANFAPDGSKLRSTPAKVEITMATNSSKVARLSCFLVIKFAWLLLE